ncbi:hypothetical protein [Clostridium perfringens]|nr:hypothetical protein [Clostridium perfringens]
MQSEDNLKDIIVALIERGYFPLETDVESLAKNVAKFEKAYYKETKQE